MNRTGQQRAEPTRLRAFFYPMRTGSDPARFPYSTSLAEALRRHFLVVNAATGSVELAEDLRRFAGAADVLFLNWPENSTGRRAVKALCRLGLAKLRGKSVVWTHHNAEPHNGKNRWSWLWLRLLPFFADHIVIHTRESRLLLRVRSDDRRVIEFFHPAFRREVSVPAPESAKRWDVLIWGSMRENKGVQDFLERLQAAGALPRLKVKVAGEFRCPEDHAILQARYGALGVESEDRFVPDADLEELHRGARFVLFAYNGASLLNSGALLTSLPRGTPILGPDVGAFREAAQRGLIRTFRNFDEALALIDQRPGFAYPVERIRAFMEIHTWENFAALLHARIAGRRQDGDDRSEASVC